MFGKFFTFSLSAFIALVFTAMSLGQVVFTDDFESYTVGGQLACQNPTDWTTWNLNPCDAIQDAYVSDLYALSGSNSTVIVWNTDVVKTYGDLTSGKYSIAFMIYIPTGKSGIFTTMSGFPAYQWAMTVLFNPGGSGSLDAGAQGATTFTFAYDTWQSVEIIVDLDNDTGEFWFDGAIVYTWQWTLGAWGEGGALQLAASDFFGFTTDDEMYVDDFVFTDLLYGTVYAVNAKINKPYMIPSIDTLTITTEFVNNYQHNFTANAIFVNSDSSSIDSLALYDDGLHGDSLANDGLWGGFINPISEEDFFYVGISTLDTQNGNYFYRGNLARFTTAGPVVLDSISISDGFGYSFNIKPFVLNRSTTRTITNPSIKLICNDPWNLLIAPSILSLPDIPPGATVGTSIQFSATYSDPLVPGYFNFKVEVRSDGWTYWTDSMQVIVTGVEEETTLPTEFSLEQNYPNPFNPSTKIKYSVPQLSKVVIKVFDILGNEIETLINEEKPAGEYNVDFRIDNLELPSGIYFYRLQAGEFIQVKKMILLK
ncbi:MAG: T9SS type A sorting domain-containing protein [Ignavibacteriaceae bacterium]